MMEYVQRELPYVRSYVLRSVYGMLRQEGIAFGEEAPGKIIAECRADGTDVSLSITAEEKAEGGSKYAGDAGSDCPAFGTYPDDRGNG